MDGKFIFGEIDAFLFFIFFDEVVENAPVEVLSTEMGITAGGFDLNGVITDFKYGDIKGTAAEVKNYNLLVIFLVKAVCQGSGSRFVKDSFYFESGYLAGLFGCLTLRVVKVCGDGDNCFFYFLTYFCLGIHFEFLENLG